MKKYSHSVQAFIACPAFGVIASAVLWWGWPGHDSTAEGCPARGVGDPALYGCVELFGNYYSSWDELAATLGVFGFFVGVLLGLAIGILEYGSSS